MHKPQANATRAIPSACDGHINSAHHAADGSAAAYADAALTGEVPDA